MADRMNSANKSADKSKRLTASEIRHENEKLKERIEELENSAWCYMCDTHKRRDKFYVSTDPLIKSALTPICKECAKRLALKIGKDKNEQEPDKDSVKLALRYLNKPYLESVWDSSVQESEALVAGKTKSNVWMSYIKNIAMVNYTEKTYADSDIFVIPQPKNQVQKEYENIEENPEIMASFEQNKKDTIRLLGYDPFVKENPNDQPFLYATLVGYLDASEDANEDRMRLSSIIEIVKGFSHIEKINDVITSLMNDIANMERNISTIKNLEDTKSKITSSVLNLAKDNGISLKHSVNSSKGENTWTGKIRKMKEMNLREQEVNLYDAEYSAGLTQVSEISNAAIIKQIRLDENDYNDMIIQQRELINKYKSIADEYEEKARLLLRENIDLKEVLAEHNIELDGDSDE